MLLFASRIAGEDVKRHSNVTAIHACAVVNSPADEPRG
jgi:hypothetical protein